MATQLYTFTVTVPAGTTQAAPQVTALTMPAGYVSRVEVRVPPGPRGVVGFALGAAGQPIIPYAAGTWVIADDEPLAWDFERLIQTGAWQLFAYNLGQFAHTLYLRIPWGPLAAPSSSVTLLPASALS